MRESKLLLDKAHKLSASYKLLKQFVKDEEYFAYIQGIHDCIAILQAYEETHEN